MNERRLRGRRRKFVAAYLGRANGNATRAAELAGFANPGPNAWRILQDPLVREAIERALAKHAMSAAEVLARLTSIARLDADDYLSTDPETGQTRVDLDRARERGVLQFVDAVSITDNGTRIKFPSKLEALTILAKHHGLLVDRISVEASGDDAAVRAEILEKLRSVLPNLPPSERAMLAPPERPGGTSPPCSHDFRPEEN